MKLALLLADPDPTAATSLRAALDGSGFEVAPVPATSEAEVADALAAQRFEVVIAEWPLALAALGHPGRAGPVVVFSSAAGEEVVVEAMRAGASDFVAKARAARLPGAIERAIREPPGRKRLDDAGFLSRIGHDLRTPLNAILGFSELLEHGVAGALTPKQLEYLGHVSESGRHLLSMINDLVDLAKLEAGLIEPSRKPCSAADLAAEAADLLGAGLSAKKLRVAIDVPRGLPQVTVDPLRFRQVIEKLIEWSAQHTPEGGEITVRARVESGALSVTVHDTGAPVMPEDVARALAGTDPGGKRASKGGNGLGLAVARRLVELHGGTIAPEASRGGGNAITARVPLPARAARLRVLVVDDEPAARRLVRAILESRGHEVVEAADVDQAMAAIGGAAPSVVVTDIQIPGGGGERLLARLRAEPAARAIPVVASTAHASAGDEQRLRAAGFDGYLPKPLDTRALAPYLESLLGTR